MPSFDLSQQVDSEIHPWAFQRSTTVGYFVGCERTPFLAEKNTLRSEPFEGLCPAISLSPDGRCEILAPCYCKGLLNTHYPDVTSHVASNMNLVDEPLKSCP